MYGIFTYIYHIIKVNQMQVNIPYMDAIGYKTHVFYIQIYRLIF